MSPPEDVAEKAIWKAVAKREQSSDSGMEGLGEMLGMLSKMERDREDHQQESEGAEASQEEEADEQEESTEEGSEDNEQEDATEDEEVLPELSSLGQTKKEKLSEAGINSENIREVSKEQLEAIDGIGPATIEDIESDLGVEFDNEVNNEEPEEDEQVESTQNGSGEQGVDLTSDAELTEEEAEEISTFV